ncbi:DUF6264 family protein [Microbacterium hominis]|uniref:Uncharacterized protein n=1 Tax=Microbacterium hominis TaxID=162426 RepID=A0A7D4UHZ1_9MICO|nr:DUF6264 family protein [Microbacterium hominis]QKJ19068.1 hypothetical protein HQM25_06565 [Microbacterium hominis]
MTDGPASDPRPRPQYGEYATPEEQRARIQQPDVTAALDTGQVADAAAPVAAQVPAPAPAPAVVDEPPAPVRSRGRSVDRIATFALLAYGLINVVTSVPAFLDYFAYADLMFQTLGVDAVLSDPAGARGWGIAAAGVLAIGWMLVAWLSVASLRRGRLSWWIPLVGGVVFTVVAGMLMVVPLMTDPAVWAALVVGVG